MEFLIREHITIRLLYLYYQKQPFLFLALPLHNNTFLLDLYYGMLPTLYILHYEVELPLLDYYNPQMLYFQFLERYSQ